MDRPSQHTTNDISHHVGGSVVQTGVVHGDIHLHGVHRGPVPRQLPPSPAHFSGRSGELGALTDALLTGTHRDAPALAVVSGPGGVGKTALAVHWLHGEREHWPDGQLYANLSAHGPGGPAASVEILGDLLHGLGVPSSDIPPRMAQRTAAYRSLTAGKAIAVLLDDAASTAQVTPLLPASPTSAVIVTSRRRLGGLVAYGGVTVAVDVVTPDVSVELLGRAVGRERVDAEPESARSLADLCGGMPIAVHLAAARLVTRPHWPLARVAAELADERRRLRALVGEDGTSSVEMCFDVSYRGLPSAAARLYRLLGLYPGNEFGPGVAAALTGTSEAEAEHSLATLAEAHMITETAFDRHGFHDLMRLHARRLAEQREPEAERQRAVWSAVSYYRDRAVAADSAATPLRPRHGPVPAEFGDRVAALDWLERESPNLIACLRTAFSHGRHELVCQLFDALWGLFLYRGHYEEWISAGALAVEAATLSGDARTEVRMVNQSAAVHLRIGEPAAALEPYRRALGVARSIGDWSGEATALEGLGAATHACGRLAEAVEYYRSALDLNEAHARHRGTALLHGYLGHALAGKGDFEAAAVHFGHSARLAASIGDVHCQAQAIAGLGTVHAARGSLTEAISELRRGLRSLPASEAAALRAPVLEKLAEVLSESGDHEGARQSWAEALAAYTSMSDPRVERTWTRVRSTPPE
ncbi:tetratricopeptide repeat protein [Amycolatopsis sp. NPDC058340]|uniref:tetratricopeptide repeat protein n=1 Tax=Amycolatopsis sp. NPDC058340 TaxID=3346453 RepID=UPI003658F859